MFVIERELVVEGASSTGQVQVAACSPGTSTHSGPGAGSSGPTTGATHRHHTGRNLK